MRLKLVIIMIRPEKRKIKNAYKVFFFFLILRASGMMLSLQIKWCGFTLQLGPPEFIKLGRRRRVRIFTIFGIPDLPISHGLFP